MKLSTSEVQKILSAGDFLRLKGYSVVKRDYCISFVSGINTIEASVEPYSDEGELSILFNICNSRYSIGWIALARDNITMYPHDRLKTIVSLLGYLEKNYEVLTNMSYCEESKKHIEQYFEKHRAEYDRAVADFLAKNKIQDT